MRWKRRRFWRRRRRLMKNWGRGLRGGRVRPGCMNIMLWRLSKKHLRLHLKEYRIPWYCSIDCISTRCAKIWEPFLWVEGSLVEYKHKSLDVSKITFCGQYVTDTGHKAFRTTCAENGWKSVATVLLAVSVSISTTLQLLAKDFAQMIFLSVTLTGIMSMLKFLDNEPLSVGWGWTKATPWIAWTSSWQSSLQFGFSWDDIEQELYCWVGNFNSLWEFAPFSGTFARFFWQDNRSSLSLFLGADLLAVFILLDPRVHNRPLSHANPNMKKIRFCSGKMSRAALPAIEGDSWRVRVSWRWVDRSYLGDPLLAPSTIGYTFHVIYILTFASPTTWA